MKLLLFALFISCSVWGRSLPLELPSPSNVNSVLFKELRTYMFQVYQRSQKFPQGTNCRLIRYDQLERPHTKRDLKLCLLTTIEEGRISQVLKAFIYNQYAGSFKYIQTGKDLTALSLRQFSRFEIPETAPGIKTEFYFDYFTFGMVNNRLALPEKVDAFLQIRSFQLNIYEDEQNDVRFRNYVLSCNDCTGVSWLKVQMDRNNITYHTGTNTGEVTPAYFNQRLSWFIITPLAQIGRQMKDKLVGELNWPILEYTKSTKNFTD